MVIFVTFAFALQTSIELVIPKNPNINKVNKPNFFNEEDSLRLSDANFQLAFSFYDVDQFKTLDDRKYVQWFAFTRFTDYESARYNILSFHPCTEDDYAKFSPVPFKEQSTVDRWKKRGLFCFDNLPDDF